jgi:tetratricopeptide (TPR) repeat protein
MNDAGIQPGRNESCPCGSGRKFKHCCGVEPAAAAAPQVLSSNEIGGLVGLISRGRLSEAELRARGLLQKCPDAGILWKILGVALLRQDKDALPALRRAAELMPHDAEAHGNLGAALHDQRQWAQSLVSLQRAVALQPDNVEALVDAADALRGLGRAGESVGWYQRALRIDSRRPEAQNNLGNAFMELGQFDSAAGCYRLALQLKPGDAQVHCNLGNALRQLGRLQDALASSRQAIALDPALGVAHNCLGLILAAQGQPEAAVASYRRALALGANDVEALNNLGTALRDLGQLREALSLYARAIEIDRARAETHCNLGHALLEFRRVDEAAASYTRALALQPDNAAAHLSLGTVQRLQGRAADAEASCRAALAIDPRNVEALSLLGELRADRGQFSEAEQLFQRAIAIDPNFPFAFFSIAAHRKMTSGDTAWLKGAQGLLAKRLPLRHQVSLRYALGKYFDDVGQYEHAFGHYRQANELTKGYGVHYDRGKLTRRADAIMDSFGAPAIRQHQSRGLASERPVFIVGMPRSGTTLTEQILASHPAVFGAGELTFWQSAFAEYEAGGLKAESSASLIPRLARDYLEHLTALSGDALRVVDKMPANFMNAGLIHAALPQARIIHMRRHPIDTCLSIYFQYFSNIHPYASDLDDLAHYYGQYVRLMDHWRASLPAATLLEVPYEGLIDDQEGWTRRMLDFIGLPWDPQCLQFHETDRVVITTSKWQVRQKISNASVSRWRNYERFIGPLRSLL